MAKYQVTVDFRNYTSHIQLVDALSPAFQAKPGDVVDFIVELKTYSKFLYSDFLLLVVATIQQLKNSGVQVTGHVVISQNDDKARYASRVNFFEQLGLEFPEKFIRHEGTGKFTEIETFTKDSIAVLDKELNLILYKGGSIDREVLQMLFWCLYEIMDNVLVHSQLSSGWVCAQLFPTQKEIRLIICDTGVGIHKSLTTFPKSKFKDITEERALELCIQNEVTSGAGMGFGLYASSEFIKENAGELLIYSGNHYLTNSGRTFAVHQGNYWNGTFVFMRIKTDVPVDYKRILPETHTLPDDYQEFIDANFGIDENLW